MRINLKIIAIDFFFTFTPLTQMSPKLQLTCSVSCFPLRWTKISKNAPDTRMYTEPLLLTAWPTLSHSVLHRYTHFSDLAEGWVGGKEGEREQLRAAKFHTKQKSGKKTHLRLIKETKKKKFHDCPHWIHSCNSSGFLKYLEASL